MQCAIIEFARNKIKIEDANSTEFKKECKNPVIDIIDEKKNIRQIGGTLRKGGYKCVIQPDTLAYKIYKRREIIERHRHRYEFNNKYKKIFEEFGMIFSGIYEEKNLVEIIELQGHPFFIGVQFHPEFQSRPDKAHPLFRAFIKAAIEYKSNQSIENI